MKKLFITLLIMLLAVSMFSCDFSGDTPSTPDNGSGEGETPDTPNNNTGDNETPDTPNDSTGDGETPDTPNDDSSNSSTLGRYTIGETPENPTFTHAYTDGKNIIYIYYVGKVDRVPVAYSDCLYFSGNDIRSIELTMIEATEESTTTIKENCLTNTTFVQMQNEIVIENGAEIGATIGIDGVAGVDAKFNVKNTTTFKDVIENTNTRSYKDFFETTQSNYSETQKTKSVTLTSESAAGYYRYTYFANCDVYAFAVYNVEERNVAISFDLSPYFFYDDMDVCENDKFGPSEVYEEKLTVSADVLKKDGLFNIYDINYQLNGGEQQEDFVKYYETRSGLELQPATKNYYTFGGWYLDAEFSAPAIVDDILANPSDITLYAKWDVINDTASYQGFDISSDALENSEKGAYYTLILDKGKLAAYALDGYKARIKATYTADVPFDSAHNNGEDDSILTVQLGTNTASSVDNLNIKSEITFSLKYYEDPKTGELVFEADLYDLINIYIILYSKVRTNDSSFIGFAGKDRAIFDNLSITVEYYK